PAHGGGPSRHQPCKARADDREVVAVGRGRHDGSGSTLTSSRRNSESGMIEIYPPSAAAARAEPCALVRAASANRDDAPGEPGSYRRRWRADLTEGKPVRTR